MAAFIDRLSASASALRRGRGGQGADGLGPVGGSGEGVVRVGVITPYRGQVQCIRQELGNSGSRWAKGSGGDGGVDVEVRESKAGCCLLERPIELFDGAINRCTCMKQTRARPSGTSAR